MKKTVDAIKYGLETLNITPKAMFSLIESSKGYEGSDYSRWLANEIIKIAEKEEVGYSQLLAKWFNIIQGIIEEHLNESICSEFEDRVMGMVKGQVYIHGMPEEDNKYGGTVVDIDWGKGLDLPFNYEFIERLPETIRKRIEDNEEDLTFLMRLGGDGKISGSPLVADAKSNGISLKSYDALLLYRIATMYRALGDNADHLYFILILNTDVLYDTDNAELIKYFLSYVKCDGTAVDSKDLFETSYTNESYALLICRSLQSFDEIQDGIVLPKQLKNGDKIGTFRYSRGSDMWKTMVADEDVGEEFVYSITEMGQIVSDELRGYKNAIGYLCNSTHLSNPVVASCPIAGSDYVILTEENFHRCLAYYGVVTSLRGQRLSSDITDIISGNPDYMNLVGNCLPLLLFDVSNHWGNVYGEVNGEEVSYELPLFEEFIHKEIEVLSVYFSYEAKELMELGKKVWQISGSWGKTFREALNAIDRDAEKNIDKEYLNAISRCQTYVCSLYNSMK